MIKISPITTYEMADFLGAERPKTNLLIDKISTDTREELGENTCFIALDGDRFSGELFIDDAIKKGAKCIISKQKRAGNVSFISLFEPRKAFLKIATREIKGARIIAVTGSAGKTTVKEMIASVLSQQFRVSSTYENHNNEIGVAQTLFSIFDEDFCVVEMGMRGLGEIDTLASACKPFISVITNCGSAHIERLGSKENIFKAKCEILKHTQGYAVVPFEERFCAIDYGNIKPVFIGNGANIEIGRVRMDKSGITADIIDNYSNEILSLRIPSIFSHDIKNALMAYSVGKICGVSNEKIKKGIFQFKNCKNRGNVLKIGDFEIIDDTYNASLESTEQAIISLAEYSRNAKRIPVLVIGDMLEIGELAREYHIKVGKIARENGIKGVLCYGSDAKYVCEGFCGGIEFSSFGQIEDYILNKLPKNSALLFKASRGMHFDKIIEDLKERINEA